MTLWFSRDFLQCVNRFFNSLSLGVYRITAFFGYSLFRFRMVLIMELRTINTAYDAIIAHNVVSCVRWALAKRYVNRAVHEQSTAYRYS